MDKPPLIEKDFTPPKKNHLDSFKKWFKKRPPKKRLAIVTGISLAVLVAGGVSASTLIKDESVAYDPGPIQSTYVAPPPDFRSPLTGALTDEASTKRPVTGVMIENSIDARPQSGLSSAGVVFEAIAEGGITRFLALYQEDRPNNIGPIRSARPYYVEWAKGFDAQYLHSGGSGEGLALIRTLGVKDLDHGQLSDRIAARVSNRFAPHNVYANFDTIDRVSDELGYETSKFTPFVRKDDPEIMPTVTASKITFDISGANYNTSYTYNAESNDYARVMAGLPHNDQEGGKQITPKVVIALVVSYGIHPNGIHSQYGSIGSGDAIIFQDGIATNVTWSKPSQSAALSFTSADGKQFSLNAGQTWITAIATNRVTYTP
jgi:hypothetical protein